MNRVFVDTSAWYALYDRRDGCHEAASRFLKETPALLITSNLIFAETLSLMTKRLGKTLALNFGRKLRASGRVRILHLDAALEESAWGNFERYHDKPWDFIDCASFALLDSLKLAQAFTFDAHFTQRGLQVVP